MERESIFPRDVAINLLKWIGRREAYAIKGPRQSGKTTLLRILEDSGEKRNEHGLLEF
jgi:predicted AAA+ superfamily ATPase